MICSTYFVNSFVHQKKEFMNFSLVKPFQRLLVILTVHFEKMKSYRLEIEQNSLGPFVDHKPVAKIKLGVPISVQK